MLCFYVVPVVLCAAIDLDDAVFPVEDAEIGCTLSFTLDTAFFFQLALAIFWVGSGFAAASADVVCPDVLTPQLSFQWPLVSP